ncbi:MAG: tetratricopeptide repeat protein [Terracidiphilus sp.]|jgi:Flp pilus assembly protein TadD
MIASHFSHRSLRWTLVVGMLLFADLPAIKGQAACTPPDSMKAQLLDKPDAAVYTDLGIWFANQKNYACAADAFGTSLQMDPNQKNLARVVFMFGVSLYFQGDVQEAIPALQEAEKLGYQDNQLHVVLATALDGEHSTKDAEAEWRAALDVDPELSTALDALSTDLLVEKNFQGVIAALEVPRLLGQRTPRQTVNLGTAYAAFGQLEKAAAVLRDGLNTTPDSVAIANQLARILVELNRKEEAVTVLELAVAQHPDDAEAKANLAQARDALGSGK